MLGSHLWFAVLVAFVVAENTQQQSKVGQCHCYCCPSKTNPYGLQPDCLYEKPDFVGQYEVIWVNLDWKRCHVLVSRLLHEFPSNVP